MKVTWTLQHPEDYFTITGKRARSGFFSFILNIVMMTDEEVIRIMQIRVFMPLEHIDFGHFKTTTTKNNKKEGGGSKVPTNERL